MRTTLQTSHVCAGVSQRLTQESPFLQPLLSPIPNLQSLERSGSKRRLHVMVKRGQKDLHFSEERPWDMERDVGQRVEFGHA